jgi:hypothetical protein
VTVFDQFESARRWAPWTLAGEPDPEFDEAARTAHHMQLTDPLLPTRFRRCFPGRIHLEYDEMVRALALVWDCQYDGTANVTGYCCATCGRTRATAAG